MTHGNIKRLGQVEKKFKVEGKSYSFGELSKSGLPLAVLSFLDNYLHSDAIEVMTSGSTGAAKAIQIEVKHMRASAQRTLSFLNLKPGDTCLLCLAPEYIAGMMMLVRWIEGDLDLYFKEPNSQPLLEINVKIDLVAMVPYQVYHSLEQLPKLTNLVVGGGAITPELEYRLKSSACRVLQSYGMTETITHIALREVSPHFQQHYRALEGVRLSVDHRSCLVIDAPAIGVSHLLTNDVVELFSDEEFRWLGRFDNVVNSGGIKLYPEELEKQLGELEIDYFFAGIPDEELGQKLVMLVESESEDMLESTRSKLAVLGRFRIPKEVIGIGKFERTASGKIRRQETLEQVFPKD